MRRLTKAVDRGFIREVESRKNKSVLQEIGDDAIGVVFVNHDLRSKRRLIRVVNAGEVLDFTGAGEPVHTFCIARFADRQRRIDKDFHETVFADQRAAFVSQPALNFDGYNFWLNKLDRAHNYNDAEMVKSFIVSSEYRGRF